MNAEQIAKLKEFKELRQAATNASFDCGEFDDSDDAEGYRNPFTQREYKYWKAALAWQAASEAAKATGTAGELPPLPKASGYDTQWRRYTFTEGEMRAYGQQCADAVRHDADAATRLRLICKLVGIESHVPADDETLWGAAFAVLGQIRAALEAARQPAPVAKVLTDEEIDVLWSDVLTINPLPQPAYRALVRAAIAATNRSQP